VRKLTIQIREEIGLAAYSISLSLDERVLLIRDPNKICFAKTWITGNVGTVGLSNLKDFVRESLRDYVDIFINDYLAANPKEQPVEEKDKNTKDD